MKHELKQLQIEKASIADDEHIEIIKTMTPQEKANELVQEYVINMPLPFHIEDAKICALIAVDEIISVIDTETNYKTWEFYKQVKQEIEKL